MNKIPTYLIVFILFSFSSCNKIKQTEKNLAGTWDIIKFRFSNYSGLSYEYPASGSMNFGNCDGGLCEYSLDMYHVVQGDTVYRNDQGHFNLNENAENYDLYLIDSTGGYDTLSNGRIIFLNDKDLKIEFTDFYQRHVLILEKD